METVKGGTPEELAHYSAFTASGRYVVAFRYVHQRSSGLYATVLLVADGSRFLIKDRQRVDPRAWSCAVLVVGCPDLSIVVGRPRRCKAACADRRRHRSTGLLFCRLSDLVRVVQFFRSARVAHAHLDISARALARVFLNLHLLHVFLAHTALSANSLNILAACLEQVLHDVALVGTLSLEHGQVARFVLRPHVGAGAYKLLYHSEVAIESRPVQRCAALGILAVEGSGD